MSNTQTTLQGTYTWELVFSYDNTGTQNTSTYEENVTIQTQINIQEFMSNQFSVTGGYSFQNQTNFALSYKGLADASTQINYSEHQEFANEIVQSVDTGKSTVTSSIVTHSFTCPADSKMNMYRLIFNTNCGLIKTSTFSSSPLSDVTVSLNFDLQERVLGLIEILDKFSHTVPGSENTVEWASIRNDITSNSAKSEIDRFHAFVSVLSTITPGSSNVEEWSAIRGTCNEILASWDTTEKESLFSKLLLRFSQTNPASSNKMEWQAIRDLSTMITQQLTPFTFV